MEEQTWLDRACFIGPLPAWQEALRTGAWRLLVGSTAVVCVVLVAACLSLLPVGLVAVYGLHIRDGWAARAVEQGAILWGTLIVSCLLAGFAAWREARARRLAPSTAYEELEQVLDGAAADT
jgi:hypothetical protein